MIHEHLSRAIKYAAIRCRGSVQVSELAQALREQTRRATVDAVDRAVRFLLSKAPPTLPVSTEHAAMGLFGADADDVAVTVGALLAEMEIPFRVVVVPAGAPGTPGAHGLTCWISAEVEDGVWVDVNPLAVTPLESLRGELAGLYRQYRRSQPSGNWGTFAAWVADEKPEGE